MNANEVIRALQLEKLEPEGGYFRRTFESQARTRVRFGENAETVERHAQTAIYYLVTRDSFSAFHRLKSAEVYHYYLGARVELTILHPDGQIETVTLGPNILAGESLQVAVESGVWQAARILSGDGGEWGLLGTTVAPGFEFDDFELAHREKLIEKYPNHAGVIRALTRSENQ